MRKVFIVCMFYAFSDGAAAQAGRMALANAAALMQQEQKAVDSTVNALIRIKEDSLTSDSVKVEIVHFLANLACDTCLQYLIDHMNDRFNYGSGSADIDQYNFNACWSLLTSLGNREPTKWKVLAAVFRSLQTKPRANAYFDFIDSVLFSVTPSTVVKSIVGARLADNDIRFDRVYMQNLKWLQGGHVQHDIILTSVPESAVGAMDGKLTLKVVRVGTGTGQYPPPFTFTLEAMGSGNRPVEITNTTGTAVFTDLGYRYYCLTVVMGNGCSAHDCFYFDEADGSGCLAAGFHYAAAQTGRMALAQAAALMQQEQKVVDSTVNALIRIKEDSLTTDSVKVEIVHFLAKLACDSCLLYLIDHMYDRFNYGSGSADIDQYNYMACWSLITSLGNREPTKWKVFAAVFRSMQTKLRDDSYFDIIVSVLVSVTPKTVVQSIVEARLADNYIRFDRVYIQNLKRLQVELNK